MSEEKSKQTWQEHNGALTFTTNVWMSPNHKAFITVTVHFQKDGMLIAMLLDLVEVTERHTGEHLAAVFTKVLEDFAIANKVSIPLTLLSWNVLTMAQILSITCNNVSNHDTMVEVLKDQLDTFPRDSNCTQCFDHIVNLVAKSIIWQFDALKAKGNESFDDVLQELRVSVEDLNKEELMTREGIWSEVEGDDDDIDGWVDEWDEMSESELKEMDDNIQPICRVLVKVSIMFVTKLMLSNGLEHSSARLHTLSKLLNSDPSPLVHCT
jgi:hypothetical protein